MDKIQNGIEALTDCKIEARNEWHAFWDSMLLSEKTRTLSPPAKKKVIVLAGPTAVGKTALSLVLAKALRGEIVSADSMQVYKGMDIGTAKLPLKERLDIPHHLIDVCDLDDAFNVADFAHQATQAIEGILARGHVPIVVGGTGFYIHALLYGPPTGPASVESVRTAWEKELEDKGALPLYLQLQELDPDYAATITPNDKNKIVRALEIITITQKKVSHFSKQSVQTSPYDMRCWFLHKSKQYLYAKIEERCDEMLAQGFLSEVLSLEERGIKNNSTASLAIGYRQALEFLHSPKSPEDWQYFVSSFKQASRRYAKRQITWFKKEPLFRWLNTEYLSLEKSVKIILEDYLESL